MIRRFPIVPLSLLAACAMRQPETRSLDLDRRGYATDCVQQHADEGFRSVQVQFVIQPDGKFDPSTLRVLQVRRTAAQARLGGAARANAIQYLEKCRMVPAMRAGEPVAYTYRMWVRVPDRA